MIGAFAVCVCWLHIQLAVVLGRRGPMIPGGLHVSGLEQLLT